MFKRHGVPRARLKVLRQVPLFHGLSDKVLARIDSQLDEITVPAGRALTTQGQISLEAFIVAEGSAQVKVDDRVVAETSVGDLIGELGIMDNTVRSATVTATTPMRLLVVDPRKMQWLFDDSALAARVQQNVDRHRAGRQPEAPA